MAKEPKQEEAATTDAASGSELSGLLSATGFEICDFAPSADDECDACDKPNKQLYFGNKEYWSGDGDYWCLECITELKNENDKYAIDQGFTHAAASR